MKKIRLYTAPGLRFLEIRPRESILLNSPGSNEGFSTDDNPYDGGWDDDDE